MTGNEKLLLCNISPFNWVVSREMIGKSSRKFDHRPISMNNAVSDITSIVSAAGKTICFAGIVIFERSYDSFDTQAKSPDNGTLGYDIRVMMGLRIKEMRVMVFYFDDSLRFSTMQNRM